MESGHRCAIHTCRHPDVDVHHIVPWAKVREHRFENLIALCPNCHRRADAGDIDRKALFMYKARLAAAFRFEEVSIYPLEFRGEPSFSWADPGARWRTLVERIDDVSKDLHIELEYPEFSSSLLGAASLNVYIRQKILSAKDSFISDISSEDFMAYPSTLGYFLNSSFAFSILTEQIASVRFTMHAFAGGVHGSHWTEVVNYSLCPPGSLELEDLFHDLTLGVRLLSSYCISELLIATRDREARDRGHVEGGAGPEPENFRRFNLTPEGVLVTFDEYTVACYADGPSEVVVPYFNLRAALNPGFHVDERVS